MTDPMTAERLAEIEKYSQALEELRTEAIQTAKDNQLRKNRAILNDMSNIEYVLGKMTPSLLAEVRRLQGIVRELVGPRKINESDFCPVCNRYLGRLGKHKDECLSQRADIRAICEKKESEK